MSTNASDIHIERLKISNYKNAGRWDVGELFDTTKIFKIHLL